MRTIEKMEFDPEQMLWRYLKPNRFLDIIENKRIYFSSATQFEDPFEGAVVIRPFDDPLIDLTDPKFVTPEKAFTELRRLTKISCWHREVNESDAMWKLYSNKGKGIAITTTPKKLKESLSPYRIEKDYGVEDLWGANVAYTNLMAKALNVSMLERFFYKHNAFSWEKEFRLAISLRLAEEFGVSVPEKGIFVEVNTDTLINNIYLGPSLPNKERSEIITKCNSMGFGDRVKVTSLLGHPIFSG